MMKFLIFFLFIQNNLFTQIQIEGTVTNQLTKAPLIGCSVFNVSKQTGTITNEEGKFKIKTEKGDLIQFSYLGMTIIEKYVIDNSYLSIEMKYQIKKLKSITIESKKESRLSSLSNPNFKLFSKPQFIEPKRKTAETIIQENKPVLGVGAGIGISIPIQWLYLKCSPKERHRLDAIVDIEKMNNSNLKYTQDFIATITKVNDQIELKDIKAYCYFPHVQVNSASYYELGLMVKDCYVEYLEYRKLNPIIVQDSIPKLTAEDFK